MPIDVVDIHNTIVSGLENAWLHHFLMTDERDEDIKPEYLTTASVCYAFSDFVSANKLSGFMIIRAEEKTRSLWRKTLLPMFMQIGNWAGLKLNSSRKGNVDISLALKGLNILEAPFGVIENKGLLLFTLDNELYAGCMNEVKKDLERNIEFVTGSNNQGIEYAGFTFYLRDKESVLVSQGKDYCKEKKVYFENLCNSLIPSGSTIVCEVEVDTLDSQLFKTHAEAIETEEDGCPAYTKYGTWNIVYGVISIYRVDKIVTHNKLFKAYEQLRAD